MKAFTAPRAASISAAVVASISPAERAKAAADLLAIADRCESATGPNYALDEAIQAALAGATIEWQESRRCNSYHRDGHWVSIGAIKPYTASLDAAMTLVGVDEYWRLGNDGEGADVASYKATVTSHNDVADIVFHDAVAETPALALTAAALRALASEQSK